VADYKPRIPPIPEPAATIESLSLTVRALMHAMDIIAANGAGSLNHQIFCRKEEYEALKADFDAYRKAHP